eukprot:Gb_05238 [translate_table: standard]
MELADIPPRTESDKPKQDNILAAAFCGSESDEEEFSVHKCSDPSRPSHAKMQDRMTNRKVPEVEISRSESQREEYRAVERIPSNRKWPSFDEDNQLDYSSGAWLTWNNLWVTANRGKTRALLQGLTGFAQPGQIMAIMGPSGSGKSTLLDALAGRLAANTEQTGDILINGRRQLLSYGTSLQLPESMSKAEKRERAEMTIKEMGLQDSVNTRIGGWRSKGISGGEKRRVSIAIEILTRPKLLFLDEPTSGLDSAAAFHVVKRLLSLARDDRRTVIASIHQPSSEVFQLFNNLCLLCGGRTVYFGEASNARQFFAINGLRCPSLRNPSDHYLRTINSDFERDIEEGDPQENMTTKEVTDLLVKMYRSSDTAQTVLSRIKQISEKEGEPLETKGSQASFITESYVLTKRSFVNMYRDLGYYWLRVGIYIALSLCVGTVFYDVGQQYTSIQARGSMLMFVATYLTFMAIGGFPSFVEDMKVFGHERLNGHYGVGAFIVANTLSSIPYLLLISLGSGAISYFLVNLHGGLDHFIFFFFILFACMTLVESMMMIVASVVPDFLMGIITGAGIQGVMVLTGGFFRLPNDLPKPVWRYPMYYIAFHKYAYQGLYKNDFDGLQFGSKEAGGPIINGNEILRETYQVEMGYSKWVDLLILSGMVIVYRLIFFMVLKFKERSKHIIKAMLSKSRRRGEIMDTMPTLV